ncbi:hypothetical protein [Agrobacterium larrymoorei]|uniref:DUF5681 domain-containing protein n=1 Tax=Agrobacterium larrymoorei TaxID=160699 RepID=A0ABU0UDX4_9HYPH|nr:hypothetical protein [Agrobacterium larrymoorei]MDQ1183145.1 hypothetical protein [Agrobacterium larrymoorei]
MAKRVLSEAQKATLERKKFRPGQTGNANGRPAMPVILKTRFEDFAEEGADILFDLIRNSKNDMVKIKGIEMIAAYIMPKAAQRVEVDVQVTHMADIQADAARARKALEAQIIDAEVIEVQPDRPSL